MQNPLIRLTFVSALVPLILLFSFVRLVEGGEKEKKKRSRGEIKKEEREFQKKVNQAVDRGVEYLLKFQRSDGSFPFGQKDRYRTGPTALALLALLASGHHRSSEPLRAGMKYLSNYQDVQTYEAAITMMMLEARYISREERLSYRKKERIRIQRNLSEEDREWMSRLAHLLTYRTSRNGWSYPKSQPPDNSNSQYALLGLNAARRCRMEVSLETWENALAHFLQAQEPRGPEVSLLRYSGEEKYGYPKFKKERATARGWGYLEKTLPGEAYGSMTAAGIASVLICQNALKEKRKLTTEIARKTARSVKDGLAWLQENFTVTENPRRKKGGNQWHYYYLYALERAGILAGTEYIGRNRWYRAGAAYLLEEQNKNGMWNAKGGASSLTDTCFALLFLKRSTIPTGVTPRVR